MLHLMAGLREGISVIHAGPSSGSDRRNRRRAYVLGWTVTDIHREPGVVGSSAREGALVRGLSGPRGSDNPPERNGGDAGLGMLVRTSLHSREVK